MSIVKDFILIVPFVTVLIYSFYLTGKLYYEKKLFLDVLKHDLKVPILAQYRALEIDNPDYELITEMKNSCKGTLDMVNTLIDSYEDDKFEQIDKLCLEELVISVYKNLSDFADSKRIDFYYDIDEKIYINANIEKLRKFISYLVYFIICSCPNKGKVACFSKITSRGTIIKLIGNSFKHGGNKFKLKNRFEAVGYEVKMNFCKKFAQMYGWSLKENIDKYNVKTFTIVIPCFSKNVLSKARLLS